MRASTLRFCSVLMTGLLFVGLPLANAAEELAAEEIVRPQPYEVFQRRGMIVGEAHIHAVGGAKRGSAQVPVVLNVPAAKGTWNVRVQVEAKQGDKSTELIPWTEIATVAKENQLSGKIEVPAGGWYRMKVEGKASDGLMVNGIVESFGVGELFVVAGQSYACGDNDERLSVTDPQQRVVVMDWQKDNGAWRVANDPQPNLTDGGTIWPPLGDHLAGVLDVPVGFANAAVGGTSSKQWLPGGDLHKRLCAAGSKLGDFRAVLWQQGESDVIEHTTTEKYEENILAIRQGAAEAFPVERPWLLAKSTLHPTVYNEPVLEGRIRAGIDALVANHPGFLRGPDTDLLAGDNRGGEMTRRHFSGIGQRRAGLMWFASIWEAIQQEDGKASKLK